ncbi:short-chain fatty acyl-CoA regulator family protein [Aliiroseovarius sp. S1339]|uniref:helix-turn-helix transcriptional regulator n=1 Tax=Aliiroseovarius sp. S1339 TaxID=2936990 RepID=UPI0020C08C54|nr:helix-turn-helix transcriptional regulator [Aliiroseovarius sp. S1339]MCK8462858.1 short-chain fatty acyl-CoA regulator family protein [Aliiroseovarius sp. S1339]
MTQSRLTGSRIRERRLFLGHKQSALAKAVGISAAYLNLIEHNRRRAGSGLLDDLARELKTDPRSLSEGAEVALLGALREAGQRLPEVTPELHRSEDFAGRFPGWSALVAAQHQRIRDLEHLVEALSDRLTHDPELAASLHEVISAVTAIRSTVGILSGGGEVDAEWQSRFMRNMRDEGRRLSSAAQGLVEYLDAGADQDMAPVVPGEELAAYLDRRDHHLSELEGLNAADAQEIAATIAALISQVGSLQTAAAKDVARRQFQQYVEDAVAMPLPAFQAARKDVTGDPSRLAAHFAQPLPSVMRRLAFVPPDAEAPPVGLVSCDGSGTLILRKALPGFAVPRFGAACPYWPLYQALSRPGHPLRAVVEMPGPTPRRFLCQAVCLPREALRFDVPPVFEAMMLIEPVDDAQAHGADGPVLPVGSSCRVCPRSDCAARREASLLSANPA